MNTYSYDSIVNRQEAEALKEMIFKRARERAESFDTEIKDSYTTGMQNEVMNLARNSFVATKNPFSIDTFEKTTVIDHQKNITEENITSEDLREEAGGLGFEQKKS